MMQMELMVNGGRRVFYGDPTDTLLFCLRERRLVNAYRRISLFGREIQVRKVLPHEEVELHLIPNQDKGILDIRIWCKNQILQSTTLPLDGMRVHF
jgi:hypothetical protein